MILMRIQKDKERKSVTYGQTHMLAFGERSHTKEIEFKMSIF